MSGKTALNENIIGKVSKVAEFGFQVEGHDDKGYLSTKFYEGDKNVAVGTDVAVVVRPNTKGDKTFWNVQDLSFDSNGKTTYTPTESVSKAPDTQVLIVRQNCVTNAVAFHQATKSKSEDDVLATAKKFEEWIYRNETVEQTKDDVPF